MTAQGAYPTTIDRHSDLVWSAPAVTYRPMLEGDAGTFQTLDAMRDAVLGRIPPDFSGYQDPFNIRAARSICASALGQSRRAQDEIAALFNWVITNIAYTPHPFNQQIVQDARRTLELREGDCVSLSVLLATLLACLGYKSRFIAQWVDGEEASHVYTEVLLPNGEWLALDAVARDKPIGWRQNTLDGGFEVPWEFFNG
jgi:transglutaminase-like putative cysteine protease